MTSPLMSFQAKYKAHVAYGEARPEFMGLALVALNRWGSNETTLAHAVAEAIAEAHAMGLRGEHPVREEPEPVRPMRRTRPAPPPPEPAYHRRTRR